MPYGRGAMGITTNNTTRADSEVIARGIPI
jgi:hypothetical protein